MDDLRCVTAKVKPTARDVVGGGPAVAGRGRGGAGAAGAAWHRAAGVVLTLAACVALGPAASGQQTYELTEQGQWLEQPAPDPDTPEGELQEVRRLLANERARQAENAASDWIDEYPGHPLQPEARLLHGDAKAARRHYYRALYDYEYIARVHPDSEQFHTALQREYEIARLFTDGVRRRFLGLRIMPAKSEGEELLIRIQERAPGSRIGERASLTLADYYYGERQMTSAAEAYQLFIENYPESQQREWAMVQLVRANLARFHGPRFDATGLIEAAQRLETYREQFPAAAERIDADGLLVRINHSLARKALLTGRWYERRNEPVSAAYTYQRILEDYPETAVAREAIDRLAAMPAAIRRGMDIELPE